MNLSVRTDNGGLTRLDLAALIGSIGLVQLCLIPLLASPYHDSRFAECANNLRGLGNATRMWANDHADRHPWWVPWAEGGTMPDGTDPWGGGFKPTLAYAEWMSFSNELVTPKRLVCPADPAKRRVTKWFDVGDPDSMLHSNNRNNSVSYPLWLDSFEWAPQAILSGDRNLEYDGLHGPCSARTYTLSLLVPRSGGPQMGVKWTNAIHGPVGNLLLNDGSVHRTSTDGLRAMLHPEAAENGVIHVVPPY